MALTVFKHKIRRILCAGDASSERPLFGVLGSEVRTHALVTTCHSRVLPEM